MTTRPLVALWLVIVVAPSAFAQSTSGQAEQLFRRGRDLMAAGSIAEACTAFEASNKLEPAATTLLNLGACREKNGQLASAFGAYSSAERQARLATDANSRALQRVAADHVARIESKLSKLTIRVPDSHRAEGLEIRRGAELVDPATWNIPLAIDGGTYEIEARAPGHEPWKTTVTVGLEGDQRAVTIPALVEIAQAPPPHEQVVRPAPQRGHSLAPLGFAALAVGALGGAAAFELWGDDTYAQAKVEQDWHTQDALWASANHKRYAAEGLAAGGLACAGIAVWLYLRGGETSTVPTASAARDGFAIGIAGTIR